MSGPTVNQPTKVQPQSECSLPTLSAPPRKRHKTVPSQSDRTLSPVSAPARKLPESVPLEASPRANDTLTESLYTNDDGSDGYDVSFANY